MRTSFPSPASLSERPRQLRSHSNNNNNNNNNNNKNNTYNIIYKPWSRSVPVDCSSALMWRGREVRMRIPIGVA